MDLIAIERLNAAQVGDLCGLFRNEWWTRYRTREQVEHLLEGSDLVFGLCEGDGGRLVAFARVLTDFTVRATIFDVIVAEDLRGQGLGRRLMERVLEHPRMVAVRTADLRCVPHMVPFYGRWGFAPAQDETVNLRRRSPSATA